MTKNGKQKNQKIKKIKFVKIQNENNYEEPQKTQILGKNENEKVLKNEKK